MQSNFKVLIMDEHSQDIMKLYTMLHATGLFDIRIASSATGTINLLENNHFHLAIIDISMPYMDGLQFIREITKRQMNTMLVLTSTHSRGLMNSISLVAKEHGLAVIGTLKKPYDDEALKRLTLQICSRKVGIPPRRHIYENPYHVFDQNMVENSLKEGSIKAWFQPKIELNSGKIIGAEALARWEHSEYGFMLAGSFLDAIRLYKLQKKLLFKILNDALDAHTYWQHNGYCVPVSVNLPVPLFDDDQLPEELFQQVIAREVDPANICFELLEDEAISQPLNYYMGISNLRLKGFGLAQDDFGRGYNSMYNLISSPFTEVKIDKAFINGFAGDDVRETALIASVQLGKQLGLTVTVEGVETMRDLQFMRCIGCDCAQGFLISSAVSAEDFGELLSSKTSEMYFHSSSTF
ncbi:EAL domain-containing response regulator [Kosakonia oryziphila]|uniref:EAL domain, c-di-GMP-specific phosphodiesterase class I (Or its enzymatically inactive variant) n=1 Tax=Kosakonia oryziphila TaxID=1005667 RepID=A0A1C4CR99_9ENTR|nr:EAL domain-containing response regulator [Kosakonia oryziphila]SCC21655.1 EAL domain, c-di-GMP-specific phosphodiesterase class I (or its enzymatically inactive variant) [Kosakonia oryziphila]